jgi:hypothetical protein
MNQRKRGFQKPVKTQKLGGIWDSLFAEGDGFKLDGFGKMKKDIIGNCHFFDWFRGNLFGSQPKGIDK